MNKTITPTASTQKLVNQKPPSLPDLVSAANHHITSCNYTDAIELLTAIIAIRGKLPALLSNLSKAYNNRALNFLHLGERSRAESDLVSALSVKSTYTDAYLNLAICYQQMGQNDAAESLLLKSLKLSPNDLDVALELANIYVYKEKLESARSLCLSLFTHHKLTVSLLNQCLTIGFKSGVAQEMMSATEKLLEKNSQDPDVHLLKAKQLLLNGDAQFAKHYLIKQTQIFPQNVQLLRQLAGNTQDDDDLARQSFGIIHKLQSSNIHAAIASQLTLPALYTSNEHLFETRKAYSKRLNILSNNTEYLLEHCSSSPSSGLNWCNFYLSYQGLDNVELQKNFGSFQRKIHQAWFPQYFDSTETLRKKRPRIGFVTSFFRNCTVGAYFIPWLKELNKHYDCYLFSLGQTDALTHSLARDVTRYIQLNGQFAEMASLIRESQLDMIIYPELGMDAVTYSLAGLRLAKTQIAAWGHPETTGLPTIDHYMVPSSMEPDNNQRYFSEHLLRLPGLGTCYTSAFIDRKKSRIDYQLPADRTLYLFPQSPFKIHPGSDDLLTSICKSDKNALIVMFEGQAKWMDELLQNRLKRSFAESGLEHSQYIRLIPAVPRNDYLQINSLCDVMLDSLYFSGGNTSLDAISTGLPIVTLEGKLIRGRQSAAMLRMIDQSHLIAHSRSDFVDLAIKIANDSNAKTFFKQQVSTHHNQIFDNSASLHELYKIVDSIISHHRVG